MSPEVLHTSANTLNLHIQSLEDMLKYWQHQLNEAQEEERSVTVKILNMKEKLDKANRAKTAFFLTDLELINR